VDAVRYVMASGHCTGSAHGCRGPERRTAGGIRGAERNYPVEAEEELRKSRAGTRGLCRVNLPATEPRLEGWVVIGASALDLGDKLQWRRDSFQDIFRVDRIVSPERQT
jgi:hypothetical protein